MLEKHLIQREISLTISEMENIVSFWYLKHYLPLKIGVIQSDSGSDLDEIVEPIGDGYSQKLINKLKYQEKDLLKIVAQWYIEFFCRNPHSVEGEIMTEVHNSDEFPEDPEVFYDIYDWCVNRIAKIDLDEYFKLIYFPMTKKYKNKL